jgi:hypothetical protein
MSGIGVAQRSELLVITGDESGTRVGAAAHIDQPSIDPKAQLGHGIGFVNVTRRKQLQSDGAEDFLRDDQEVPVVLAASANIEQPDQHAFRADANGVIEISGDTLSDKDGGYVGTCDRGEDGWNRFHDRGGSTVGAEAGKHGRKAQRRT